MGCSPIQSLIQCTGQPSETEEEVVQGENHSDHSLHVLGNEAETTEEAPNTENESEQEMQQNIKNIQNTDIETRREKRRLIGQTAMPKVNGSSLTLVLMQF